MKNLTNNSQFEKKQFSLALYRKAKKNSEDCKDRS